MPKIIEKIFAQRRTLELDLLDTTLNRLSSAIRQKGYASMLLSGGQSPVSFYRLLAHAKLNWEKVYLGLSDERWVPPDHPDSNEKCIRDSLLRGNAQAAQFIGFKTTHDNVLVSADESEKQLKKLPRPFNIVLLGMGEDGHIASLFPDSPDLEAAMSPDCKTLCHPIRQSASTTPRISMTLPTLLDSESLVLLFFGEPKWKVYQTAKRDDRCTFPVRSILQQDKVPVTVYWTV